MIVWLVIAGATVLLLVAVVAIGLGCLLAAGNADRLSGRDEG